ncbi:MAG: HK97 gp10 family phage protein [Phycisphaerales bacterium]|nr:HK97 gp10 family phage protein [Phycisphaerales bacterium]
MASVKITQVKGGAYILGLDDIRRNMRSLPRRLGIAVARRGLYAGAKVVRDEARRLAPQPPAKSKKGYSRTGKLKKAIVAESRGVFKDASGKPTEHRASVLIARKGKTAARSVRAYAHFVEYGTRPHAVGKGSILEPYKRSKKKKKQVGRMHPGTSPQPFMRPAFDTKKIEALHAIADTTRAELAKELAAMKSTARKAG